MITELYSLAVGLNCQLVVELFWGNIDFYYSFLNPGYGPDHPHSDAVWESAVPRAF